MAKLYKQFKKPNIPFVTWDPNNGLSKLHRIRKKMLKFSRRQPFSTKEIQTATQKIIKNGFWVPTAGFKDEGFFAKSTGWFGIDSAILRGDGNIFIINPLCGLGS